MFGQDDVYTLLLDFTVYRAFLCYFCMSSCYLGGDNNNNNNIVGTWYE